VAWESRRRIASLVAKLGIRARLDASKLQAYFLGPMRDLVACADDEAELRKALGRRYHKVYFDEGQKIPPKLEVPIREVFMPTLLISAANLGFTGSSVLGK